MELCRDEFGIWSGRNVSVNPDRPKQGEFINSANVTTAGNTRPIRYVSDRLSWLDRAAGLDVATTKEAELEVYYDVYIK